ncbi:MAG: hypothetical protein RL094_571 [Candidatus Parcubacteria bacterium]|jgi:hypothetical protein
MQKATQVSISERSLRKDKNKIKETAPVRVIGRGTVFAGAKARASLMNQLGMVLLGLIVRPSV